MKVCIECQQEVVGKRAVRVKEDRIIGVLRWLKRKLGIAKENELYVCEDHLKRHLEKRKDFEKSMVIFAILTSILLLILLVSIAISGRIELWAIVSTIALIVLLVFFSLVFRYVPNVESTEPELIQQEKEMKKKKRG